MLRECYDPREFEEFVAQLWRGLGYKVELTPRSGDHGADVIATKGRARIAIECKRYQAQTSVGNDVVRGVAAHKQDQANPATQAMVVTTGRFTTMAVEAGQRFGVELIGPQDLLKLMEQAKVWPDRSRALSKRSTVQRP